MMARSIRNAPQIGRIHWCKTQRRCSRFSSCNTPPVHTEGQERASACERYFDPQAFFRIVNEISGFEGSAEAKFLKRWRLSTLYCF